MLLFFCPSVTWLAFYIRNTQKLGLLFKQESEGERENVKWKSAMAVIYQSGEQQQQFTSKWEFHRNVKLLLLSEKSLNTTSPLPSAETSHWRVGKVDANKYPEIQEDVLHGWHKRQRSSGPKLNSVINKWTACQIIQIRYNANSLELC